MNLDITEQKLSKLKHREGKRTEKKQIRKRANWKTCGALSNGLTCVMRVQGVEDRKNGTKRKKKEIALETSEINNGH